MAAALATDGQVAIRIELVALALLDSGIAALLTSLADGTHAVSSDDLNPGETFDEAAGRILRTQAGIERAYFEQLYTYEKRRAIGARNVTIAYIALLRADHVAGSLRRGTGVAVADIVVPWPGEAGGPVEVHDVDGNPLPLADGDAALLGNAMLRLRGKLDYSAVGFSLLPKRFTLRQLQDVHEAILGVRLNKPSFRRRMLEKGWLETTGEREAGTAFRPAELYRYRPTKGA